MIIRPEPLTRDSFKAFGEIVTAQGVSAEWINAGHTQKFADLAKISLRESGRPQLHIYRSNAIELPFRIELLERHPLGSQMFYPLHDRPFPVIVATADAAPDAEHIRAFISDGRQGINLYPNVWHHYQLTLAETSDYIVVDRGGSGNNCEEHRLSEEVFLEL